METDIRQQLTSGGQEQRAYVRELLSSSIDDQLGAGLMWFLDRSRSMSELLSRYPVSIQTIEAWLQSILESDYTYVTSWLQATTIHALALPANRLANAQLLTTALKVTPAVADDLGLHEGRFAMFSQIEQIIALKSTPFFADTDEAALARISGVLAEQQLSQGQTLFAQGEEGDCLYILVSGALDIQASGQSIVTYGPGDVVGEMAVIDSQPRSADGIALTDCELLRLDRHSFDQVIEMYPEVARQVMKELSGRLRHTAGQLEKANKL